MPSESGKHRLACQGNSKCDSPGRCRCALPILPPPCCRMGSAERNPSASRLAAEPVQSHSNSHCSSPFRCPAGTRHMRDADWRNRNRRTPQPCATPPDPPTGSRRRQTRIPAYCAPDQRAFASPARTPSPPAAAHACDRSAPRLRHRWTGQSARRRRDRPRTDALPHARRGSGRCW